MVNGYSPSAVDNNQPTFPKRSEKLELAAEAVLARAHVLHQPHDAVIPGRHVNIINMRHEPDDAINP